MDTEDFKRAMRDPDILSFIWAQVRSRSHRPEVQEEMVQEAWLAISTLPSAVDRRLMWDLIRKTVYSCYWQENKERLLFEAHPPLAAHQRIIYYDENAGGPRETFKDLY